MENYFTSKENKHMLWQLLLDNNAFSDIPDNFFSKIQNIFEETINKYELSNENITNKNKLVLKTIMDNIKFFKQNTILKPLEEVNITINQNYENKKDEFMNLIKKPVPKKINFDDNNNDDSPINENEMTNLLNDMIKNRNLDLDLNLNQKDEKDQKEKKVTFNDVNKLNFINKLKKNTDNINDINSINDINNINEINEIKSMLKEILLCQKEIISIIKST